MKRKNKFLVLISTILISTILILSLSTPSHKETIPTSFTAGENPGFDLSPGHLNFGKIIPGSYATRSLAITNSNDYTTITTIKSSGKISKYLIVSDNNFALQPNQSKNITFTAYPEEGIELKDYPGEIIITTSKSK